MAGSVRRRAAPRQETPPKIIVILGDDTGWFSIGA
jgi:hypothetical protein